METKDRRKEKRRREKRRGEEKRGKRKEKEKKKRKGKNHPAQHPAHDRNKQPEKAHMPVCWAVSVGPNLGQRRNKLTAGLRQLLWVPRTKQHTNYLSNELYKPPTDPLINMIFIFYLHNYNF